MCAPRHELRADVANRRQLPFRQMSRKWEKVAGETTEKTAAPSRQFRDCILHRPPPALSPRKSRQGGPGNTFPEKEFSGRKRSRGGQFPGAAAEMLFCLSSLSCLSSRLDLQLSRNSGSILQNSGIFPEIERFLNEPRGMNFQFALFI